MGDANTKPPGASEPDASETAASGPNRLAERRPDDLSSELKESKAQHLRLAADFANFRKRAQQEQREMVQHAGPTLSERLLPVLDDGERALQQLPQGVDENWVRGIRLTFEKLREALASLGVKPIDAVGAPFDPRLHEAVGSQESSEHPEGTLVEELRRGYRIGDRVLRPSLVKLARRPEEAGVGQPQDS
ncbi:MAG: nucleotide exchange factor GrpE [Candidatus Dormibacteraeota bacterium]|nr:nucleotide exchange factor GrpE [Candidatus Dormibacteraeota bacterium]